MTPVAGKDYKLALPKGHLSFSQIDMYWKCPRQYEEVYVKGNKGPTSLAMIEGTIFGKTIEKSCLEYLRTGEHLPLKRAIRIHAEIARDETREVTAWNGEDIDDCLARGGNFLEKLWANGPSFKPVMLDGRPGCEYEIDAVLAGVPIKGFVDLLEENMVTDFKVAKTAKYYNVERSLQLDLYAGILGRKRLSYLVMEKETGKITDLPASKDPAKSLAWATYVVSQVSRGISLGVFPPCNPAGNFLCSKKWCHVWGECYGSMGGK